MNNSSEEENKEMYALCVHHRQQYKNVLRNKQKGMDN